jgi:hypothetical protein
MLSKGIVLSEYNIRRTVGVKGKVFFHVHGMKAYRVKEVWLHLFLSSALDGSGSHSRCEHRVYRVTV